MASRLMAELCLRYSVRINEVSHSAVWGPLFTLKLLSSLSRRLWTQRYDYKELSGSVVERRWLSTGLQRYSGDFRLNG